jgi:hypothetical protein
MCTSARELPALSFKNDEARLEGSLIRQWDVHCTLSGGACAFVGG